MTDFFFRGLLLEARVLGDELDAAYATCNPVVVNSMIHLHERTGVEKDPSKPSQGGGACAWEARGRGLKAGPPGRGVLIHEI